MKIQKLSFCALLSLLLLGYNGWSQKRIESIQDSGKVPFEMVKNTILVPVTINGKTYKFVLDTGGVFSISKKIEKEGNFETIESITVSDANGHEKVFDKIKVDRISLGALDFINKEALVLYENESYPEKCFGADGMISRDFFTNMILQFDYEKNSIRLSNDSGIFSLDENYKAKMRISERGIPDILLNINGDQQFIEFDSGSGDFFSYKTRDAKKLKVASKNDKLKFKGIFSYGVSSKNKLKSSIRYKAKVNKLTIGATHFKNFYSNFSKKTEPRIGASILYHGKVTVDYKNLKFYFEPYKATQKIPLLETFGFDIVYLNGEYLIKWVLMKSIAHKKGLKYGMKIKSINSIAIEQMMQECEGYINGYPFHYQDEVLLEYYDEDGAIKSVKLKKNRF